MSLTTTPVYMTLTVHVEHDAAVSPDVIAALASFMAARSYRPQAGDLMAFTEMLRSSGDTAMANAVIEYAEALIASDYERASSELDPFKHPVLDAATEDELEAMADLEDEDD